MKLFRQIAFIARAEALFFRRFPKLMLATVAVVLIPAVYALIYLSSVWDPQAHTGALPVGLVNLDDGVEYREHVFNAGRDVANTLREKKTFGFQDLRDPQEARRQVRDGTLAFALIIPKDFSSNAIPGREAGGGKLVVFTSEGNNFESARIAKVFAQELGHEVNETLNERRWKLVLSTAAGSQRSVDRLREGVEQLQSGAKELSAGAKLATQGAHDTAKGSGRLHEGVGQLTGGVKQLADGLRTMDLSRARGSELRRLQRGAEELAAGQVEFGKGMAELKAGSGRLREGVQSFRSEAKSSLLVPGSVVDGLDHVQDGVVQLDNGLLTAAYAQQKLATGASQVSTGVEAVTSGMLAMNRGIRTMVSKLPQDRQLDELDQGAGKLASATAALADGNQKIKAGADRLSVGLDLLASSLPASVDAPDGSAQGLANSVSPVVEVEAPVSNSGSGFAPNVLPAALWLGAGIAAFLIHVRVLPRHAQFFSRPAQAMGKMAIPALIVLAQAAILLATVTLVLRIPVAHPMAFTLTLAVAALTFLAIVFAMTRAFGDAGKALAMIFLAVQLSSSGGVLPVELSGGVFASLSPWLPLTWVVRAIKASLFDAYGGNWMHPVLIVSLGGILAILCSSWVGRWRFVRTSSVRPAIDF
ncbi:MAG: YhgE/Pip domain-containing protein [Burkholderiales bacterium]|nr:YhgE/Pip domain-containing protein [Burkholderiales bacterium]